MNDKLKAFAEKVSKDETLQGKIRAIGSINDEAIEKIISVAKDAGYELSKADFENCSKELSVEEMQAVSGSGACACMAFGQGNGDGLACTCLAYGKGTVEGCGGISSQGGCICPGMGAGATRRH